MTGNSGGTVVRTAELDIHSEYLDAYDAFIAEETRPLSPMNADPAQIRIPEVYASQEDYEAHLQTPHFLKYKTLTSLMVKSLRLAGVDPIRMCGKSFDTSSE